MSLFNYECDEVKRIIEEVSPNYPQLTTYEKEWLYFHKNGYIPGIPVELEYETVSVNPTGSVSNAIPFKYKSAILKGNTLVNLLNKLTVNGEVGQATNWYTTTYTTGTVKSGTYILLYHVKETSGTMTRNTPGIRLADGTYLYHGYDNFNTTTGIKKWIFTVNEDLSGFGYWLTDNTGKVVVEDFILLEYQEGMENWDIPYFEGMQSVKMPALTTSNEDDTKTNILTVNEPVELRGVGETKDELNLITGELTQRIGEIVLDGSDDETWMLREVNDNTSRFTITRINVKANSKLALSDYFKLVTQVIQGPEDEENLCVRDASDGFGIRILNTKAKTVSELKVWLAQNPIAVQYELGSESVKTVDLTPLNKPYEETNYYHLESNIPCEAILEVPVVSTGKQTLEEINN